jgi:hypothetical protein
VPRRWSSFGNRQLNNALHRFAIIEVHYHTDACESLQRRRADGDTKAASVRALKRFSPTTSTVRCSPTPTKPHPFLLTEDQEGAPLMGRVS